MIILFGTHRDRCTARAFGLWERCTSAGWTLQPYVPNLLKGISAKFGDARPKKEKKV